MCLYTAALDAGHHFVEAILMGDSAAAAAALDARDEVIRELSVAALPPPAAALQEQYRAQSKRIERVLSQQFGVLSAAVAGGARVAAAHRGYRPDERAPRLDTAPRS